ncbi:MAG: hypothetical protein LZF86_110458 [Nitrospira sp.]|nr:MAG: hypothetical protein LZF86_110458 [Nitrospira sp.]
MISGTHFRDDKIISEYLSRSGLVQNLSSIRDTQHSSSASFDGLPDGISEQGVVTNKQNGGHGIAPAYSVRGGDGYVDQAGMRWRSHPV